VDTNIALSSQVDVMTTIQFRRGSASQWRTANPVLSAGEPGFELDTGKYKIGDGSTPWSDLDHFVGTSEVSGNFSSLSVDGVVQPTYDIDSTPITAGDLGAYTQAEVDSLITDTLQNKGPWPPSLVVGTGSDLSGTSVVDLAGLRTSVAVSRSSEIWQVDLCLDVSSTSVNTAALRASLVCDPAASGDEHALTVQLPTAGMRTTAQQQWIVRGMPPGSREVKVTAALSGSGAYRVGEGSTLLVRRVA
jgi:hypothetical protein